MGRGSLRAKFLVSNRERRRMWASLRKGGVLAGAWLRRIVERVAYIR